jgi:protein SCO1/2
VAAATAALLLSACGSDAPTLSGYEREPAPEVGSLALPDLTNRGAKFPLQADPGRLLIVYFGYTNCPDYCPTTMSDLRLALRRLDDADAARVDVAMVTVDPARDIPVLPDYIGGFFPDGHALGTDDAALLAEVAAPFGVAYDVSVNDAGDIEVGHTTSLYAVDDTGHLALTWQFNTPIEDLADDLKILLDREEAA